MSKDQRTATAAAPAPEQQEPRGAKPRGPCRPSSSARAARAAEKRVWKPSGKQPLEEGRTLAYVHNSNF